MDSKWKKLVKDELGPMVAEVIENGFQRSQTLSQPKTAELARQQPGEQEIKRGFAKCVQYLYAFNNDAERAIAGCRKNGDNALADAWERAIDDQAIVSRAMGQDTLTGGGALVPPQFADEFIQALVAKSVMRRLGLFATQMRGSLTLPYVDTAPTPYYVGESQDGTPSDATTGQLQLSEKTLMALTPMSNQWLRSGGSSALQAVESSMVKNWAAKEDVTFIRSDGTQNTPKGMRYWAQAANVVAANATVNLANVTIDLGKPLQALMTDNVSLDGCAWVFSPRTWNYLNTVTDGNGNRVFAAELTAGRLNGFPYAISSQIPENIGVGGNESEIYFANFAEGLIVADSQAMEVEVFPNGHYNDGSVVVSGISRNESVVRVIGAHDFGSRYRGKDIYVLNEVKWGA